MATKCGRRIGDEGWSEMRALLTDLYCAVDRLEALFPGRFKKCLFPAIRSPSRPCRPRRSCQTSPRDSR